MSNTARARGVSTSFSRLGASAQVPQAGAALGVRGRHHRPPPECAPRSGPVRKWRRISTPRWSRNVAASFRPLHEPLPATGQRSRSSGATLKASKSNPQRPGAARRSSPRSAGRAAGSRPLRRRPGAELHGPEAGRRGEHRPELQVGELGHVGGDDRRGRQQHEPLGDVRDQPGQQHEAERASTLGFNG